MIIDDEELDEEQLEHFSLLADAFFENLDYDNAEFSGLGVDSKRPFGNSYVERDILDIIGLPSGEDEDAIEERKEYALWLYYNLKEFLQKRWKELGESHGK